MISKTDVVYTVQQFGPQYQATVTVHVLNGVQFAGAVAASAKEAEQNAAAIALEHHAGEVAALPEASKKSGNKKRKPGDGEGGPPPGQKGANKMLLNTAVSRILKRPLTKQDVVFTSAQVPGGHQATLQMPGLPGPWSTLAWAGEVDSSQKDAEDHAAAHGLAALEADATLAPLLAGAKLPKGSAGEGTIQPAGAIAGTPQLKVCKAFQDGNCKWGDECFFVHGELPADAAEPPKIQPVGELAPGAVGFLNVTPPTAVAKNKPKKKAKEPVGELPRTRISSTLVTGTVDCYMKWGFGWVTLDEKVEHDAAEKNKGKVYLNKKDWKHEEPPQKGQAIRFFLYADDAGLGAEEADPVDPVDPVP